VRKILDELQAEVVRRRPERQDLLAEGILLVPHRLTAGQRHRPRVTEAADAVEGAEVVVERSVLLHQDDDVLDVLDVAGPAMCRDRGGLIDAVRHGGERGRRSRELQEPPAVDVWHTGLLTGGWGGWSLEHQHCVAGTLM
jgi:hypothetical protein